MTSSNRLRMCGLMIVMSAIYAVLVVQDAEVATAVSAFYIAALLTILGLTNVWKKP